DKSTGFARLKRDAIHLGRTLRPAFVGFPLGSGFESPIRGAWYFSRLALNRSLIRPRNSAGSSTSACSPNDRINDENSSRLDSSNSTVSEPSGWGNGRCDG